MVCHSCLAICFSFNWICALTLAWSCLLGTGGTFFLVLICHEFSRSQEFRIENTKSQCCTMGHRNPHDQNPLTCDREILMQCIAEWFGNVERLGRRKDGPNSGLKIIVGLGFLPTGVALRKFEEEVRSRVRIALEKGLGNASWSQSCLQKIASTLGNWSGPTVPKNHQKSRSSCISELIFGLSVPTWGGDALPVGHCCGVSIYVDTIGCHCWKTSRWKGRLGILEHLFYPFPLTTLGLVNLSGSLLKLLLTKQCCWEWAWARTRTRTHTQRHRRYVASKTAQHARKNALPQESSPGPGFVWGFLQNGSERNFRAVNGSPNLPATERNR
jgi:hypothetical protein